MRGVKYPMTKRKTAITSWDELPIVLTPEDVARLLNMSESNVRKMFRNGIIPAKKVGELWRTTRETLEVYINEKV